MFFSVYFLPDFVLTIHSPRQESIPRGVFQWSGIRASSVVFFLAEPVFRSCSSSGAKALGFFGWRDAMAVLLFAPVNEAMRDGYVEVAAPIQSFVYVGTQFTFSALVSVKRPE